MPSPLPRGWRWPCEPRRVAPARRHHPRRLERRPNAVAQEPPLGRGAPDAREVDAHVAVAVELVADTHHERPAGRGGSDGLDAGRNIGGGEIEEGAEHGDERARDGW